MSTVRFSPWAPTIVMGVVTILFSLYALQSQSELVTAKKEIEELKGQALNCERVAAEERKRLELSLDDALKQLKEAEQRADETLKKSR